MTNLKSANGNVTEINFPKNKENVTILKTWSAGIAPAGAGGFGSGLVRQLKLSNKSNGKAGKGDRFRGQSKD
jgi:hypothetical protein